MMSKNIFGLDISSKSKYLSVLAAGVMTSGTLFAAESKDLIMELADTLQPAKAIKPTEEQVKQVMTARESFGFNSDQEYVRELLTNPEQFGAVTGFITGGHYATPEEAKELMLRLVVQEDALKLQPIASKDRDFAGMYVDDKGVLNIGFTVNARVKVDELRQKAEAPERISAFTAERTMGELENSKQRIVNSTSELTAAGVVVSQVAIDIANNRVKVGIVDLDPEKRQLIERQFGKVDVFENALNEVEHRSDTADIMAAGIRITNSSGGGCTSNWKARDRSTNRMVMITAGHCADSGTGTTGGPGQNIFQGSDSGAPRQIGTSDQSTWTFPTINFTTGARSGSAPVDAMRVPFSGVGSMPWLYAYDDANSGVFSDGEKVPVADADGTVVVGIGVCSAGQFSPANQVGGSNWKNCGTVSDVNVASGFRRSNGSIDTFTVLNANIATYVAIPGDSGAPIWRLTYDSTDGFEAVAVGHHTGGPTGAEVFNNIDRVEDALNVDIVHF